MNSAHHFHTFAGTRSLLHQTPKPVRKQIKVPLLALGEHAQNLLQETAVRSRFGKIFFSIPPDELSTQGRAKVGDIESHFPFNLLLFGCCNLRCDAEMRV
jgi:hypothetical protein